MKVLIVEDETIAYDYLSKLIAKVDPAIEIVAVTESIAQTVNWLRENPSPDLIFYGYTPVRRTRVLHL